MRVGAGLPLRHDLCDNGLQALPHGALFSTPMVHRVIQHASYLEMAKNDLLSSAKMVNIFISEYIKCSPYVQYLLMVL